MVHCVQIHITLLTVVLQRNLTVFDDELSSVDR